MGVREFYISVTQWAGSCFINEEIGLEKLSNLTKVPQLVSDRVRILSSK